MGGGGINWKLVDFGRRDGFGGEDDDDVRLVFPFGD
jgi:hypothetical protein